MVFGKGPYSLCENFPTLIIAQKQPQIINKHKNIWLCFSTTLFKKTSSVQFSCSVVSNSFQPHELQHARPPCPSTTSGVYPNSCPLSRWCHPPSHPLSSPSPPTFNLSQHQGLFKWVSSSHQVAKVLEFQLQHQSFQSIPRMISFRMDWSITLGEWSHHRDYLGREDLFCTVLLCILATSS